MANRSKNIAKNTILLYIRTIVIMLISIYSSRVLLEKLGIDNFGIYSIVGGVVGIFSSLKGVFAQSVQRFLNFEKGKGNTNKVSDVFNVSLLVHLVLALVFTLVVAFLGIWYIPSYLVLPEGALHTALFIFCFSLLTAFFQILTIPYDSAIIANEKFGFFAWMSIIEAASKLGILYMLHIFGADVLRTYAVLLAIVTIVIRIIHIVYSTRFAECRIRWVWDKVLFKELASFSGWNFLGNSAFTLTNEGINFVLNAFGGVTANAARGVAYQVRHAVQHVSSNVMLATRPYVTEMAASKGKQNVFNNSLRIARVMFVLMALTALPIIIYTKQILNVWLVEVPDDAVIFVQLVMLHLVLRSPQSSVDLIFSSLGQMKWYQIVQSISLFMSLPLSYILLKIGFPIYWAFISICMVEVVTLVSIVICAKITLGFDLNDFIKRFLFMALKATLLYCIIGFVFYKLLVPCSVISLILFLVLLAVTEVIATYFLIFNKDEKQFALSFIKKLQK